MSEETAVQILNQYPEDEYNVLAPATMTQVSPWHRVIVSEVRVDPSPNGGDVYRQHNGELSLRKEPLLRLADAAGIRFPSPPQFTRDPEDGSYDCTIAAEKQDPDGTWRRFFGSYRWDVTERLESIKDPNSRAGQAEARMIKTFSMQRAETGAIARAVRKIIQLKQAYAPPELQKPFIVARINFDPWNDPMVREAYRQALSVRLAENVALMHGDYDEDDPLGLDGPHKSTRPSAEQLAAATQTLALIEGKSVVEESGDNGHDPEGQAEEQQDEGEGESLSLYPDAIRCTSRIKAKWQKGKQDNYSDAQRVDQEPVNQPISKGALKAVQAGLTAVITGRSSDGQDNARRQVLLYLYGVDSGNRLTELEGKAILDWLAFAGEESAAQVESVLRAFQAENGQETLPGM